MKKVLTVCLIALIAVASVFAQGASETASEAKLQKVRVAYMPNYASLCSVVAGMETGAFAEEGLEVELVEFADGPTIIAAMESGSIDIGYIGHGAHKLCINGRAKIFAMSHVGNGDAVIALQSHGIKSAADLKGKKVGYASGTSSETILKWTLESVGLTMNDIQAMEMDASGIVSAMNSGSLDACAAWSPSTFIILEAGKGDAVKLSDNLTFSDRTASISSWIVMDKFAKENRDTLIRYTRALYKGMDYRAANVEETCKAVAKAIGSSFDTMWAQRGDAEWITSAELIQQVKDGSMERLYETQKVGFGDAADQNAKVSDYVLFDVMLEAAK